jgi:hypothetical protein
LPGGSPLDLGDDHIDAQPRPAASLRLQRPAMSDIATGACCGLKLGARSSSCNALAPVN